MPVDIDRDAAHEAAQHELAKPIYPRPSVTERITDWFNDLLYRLATEGSSVPGGWLTISVLVILLVAAVVVAVRIARRTMRTDRGDYALFGGRQRSAAEHRATAQQLAAGGDWAAAVRHRLRAVGRQLEESGMLSPVPGRTATELARDGGQALPVLSDEFASAATVFNDVTYGQRPGTEAAYRVVADLDDHLRSRGAAPGVDAGAPTAPGWVQVR